MHQVQGAAQRDIGVVDRAEVLAVQGAAALQVSARPSVSAVRIARQSYLQALRMLESDGPLEAGRTRWPLRQLSRRVDGLLWRSRIKHFSALVRRAMTIRTMLLLGLTAAGVAAVPLARKLLRPDVLSGARPTLSSEWARCEPRKNRCAGAVTRILFHTKEEPNPFVQYDIGRTVPLRCVEVTNRRDGNDGDRAVPLLIFTSLDGKTWREVARREYWFETFRAEFPRTETRYLKLQVGRRSMLHLEAVRAWE